MFAFTIYSSYAMAVKFRFLIRDAAHQTGWSSLGTVVFTHGPDDDSCWDVALFFQGNGNALPSTTLMSHWLVLTAQLEPHLAGTLTPENFLVSLEHAAIAYLELALGDGGLWRERGYEAAGRRLSHQQDTHARLAASLALAKHVEL